MITEKLNAADLEILRIARQNRFRAFRKTIWVSILIPLLCGLAIVLFLNLIVIYGISHPEKGSPMQTKNWMEFMIYPKNWGELFKFGLIAYSFSYLFCVAAIFLLIVQLIKKIIPTLMDGFYKTKRVYLLQGSKYAMPQFDQYFIQTLVPDYPFFHISHETYERLTGNETFQLEVTTWSNTFLCLKIEETQMNVPIVT